MSYGHALRTEKNAQRTFGRGDVRGVIAAESATNAKEGGGLVPTVAFGAGWPPCAWAAATESPWPSSGPEPMRRVAVLGAGTMGNGIAQVFAQAGHEVTLRDLDQAILDRALGQIDRSLAKLAEKGKISAALRDDACRTHA